MTRFLGGVVCWLLLVAGAAAQQGEGGLPTYVFPVIVDKATDFYGFVPKGWVPLEAMQGDLNGDGRPDLLILMQGDDNRYRYVNEGLGSSDVNANARILIVALANESGGYTRLVQNNVFVPPHDDPVMDEPFEGMDIKKGVMRVNFRYWASAGSWSMATYTYAFRYQGGRMTLIGYDEYYRHRASGEERMISANLSTGKQKLTTVDGESGKEQVTWKRFEIKPLPTLDEIDKSGLSFGSSLFRGD